MIQINDQPLKTFRHPEKSLVMLDDLRFKDRWTIQRAIRQAQKAVPIQLMMNRPVRF